MELTLAVVLAACLICSVRAKPVETGEEPVELPTLSAPPPPENFACSRGSTVGSAVCSWDALPASALDETDMMQGYSIRFWTEGAELSTQEEKYVAASATKVVLRSEAEAEDQLAVQIHAYTSYYEGEPSDVILVPMA